MQKTQTKLTKEQMHAIGLLSIGVFLEDFDVMLFLHTAIWINDLFFPKTNPLTQGLITAFSFCSSYFLTPFGALFFGYIGDKLGRKTVIVLSSMLMAGCCITVAFLPTYAQIGITAPVILTLCRMLQNMSGTSEINGVEIYLSESVKPPLQYPIVALVPVFSRIGNICALSLAAFFSCGILPEQWAKEGWRFAFLVGAMVGVVGAVARRSLKEASEFADRQRAFKAKCENSDTNRKAQPVNDNRNIPFATSLSYFLIYCGRPICFYFIFFHCAEILKNTFEYTPQQIIMNNLMPITLNMPAALLLAALSYKISPLKILKYKMILFLLCIVAFPAMTKLFNNPKTILAFQCILVFFRFDHIPAAPVLIKHFPVLKRFRYSSFILSLAAVITYVITSFGLVFLTKSLGNNAVLFIIIPVGMCFGWAVRYFEKKEAKTN